MHSVGSTGAVTARHIPFFAAKSVTLAQILAGTAPTAPALTASYMTLIAVTVAACAPTPMGYFVTDTEHQAVQQIHLRAIFVAVR